MINFATSGVGNFFVNSDFHAFALFYAKHVNCTKFLEFDNVACKVLFRRY